MHSLAGALYVYVFQRDALQRLALDVAESPPFLAYAAYLLLGCVRGFTLVPATYLVVAGMLILPPVPLYLAHARRHHRVVGRGLLLCRSHAVRSFFERRYGPQVARLRALMTRRELPIVVAWSFFPIAPTDLVCYVCGALKVDVKKCLMGVTVGEGAICAIYIFLGGQALAWLR